MEEYEEQEDWEERFEEQLGKWTDLLFNVFVNGQYVGGVYQGKWHEATEDNVERWRQQLRDAVDLEEYEEAAKLRDKIKKAEL